LSGLNQIQKRIQNLLKNGFEKLEKEKEKDFSLISVFGPTQPERLSLLGRPGSSPATRAASAFTPRAARLPFSPAPFFGPSRRRPSLRAIARRPPA
jgi:hypothetical protein